MLNHECEAIFEKSFDNGRTLRFGKLINPVEGFESETHCIHITSPVQETINFVNWTDAGYFAILAYVLNNNKQINETWVRHLLHLPAMDIQDSAELARE